jgi:hypothetical protein
MKTTLQKTATQNQKVFSWLLIGFQEHKTITLISRAES